MRNSGYDVAVRYGRGVYPGLRSELCLPVEVFPVCSPALLRGGHPLREPADLKYHTLLHDGSTYDDGSNPDWGTWLRHAGVTDVDATRGPSFWPSHRSAEALAGWRRAMEGVARWPNVAVKISGLGQRDRRWTQEANVPIIRDTIEIFGANR